MIAAFYFSLLFFSCLVISAEFGVEVDKEMSEGKDNDRKSAPLSPVSNDFVHDSKYKGKCADYTAFGGKVPDLSFVDGKPFFSWDHVPVFWHGGNKQGLTDEEIGFIAHHPYSTATLEKFEGIFDPARAGDAETKLLNTAAKIKAINPKSQVLFFQNTVISFPNYEMDCHLRKQNWHLKSDENKYLPFKFHSYYPWGSCNGKDSYHSTNMLRIFDHSGQGFLDYWKERMVNLTSSDLFSGVFLDRILYGLPMQDKALKWKGKMSDGRIAKWFKDFDRAIEIVGEVAFAKKKIVIGNNRNFDLSETAKYGRMYEKFVYGPNSMKLSPYTQIMSVIKEAKNRILHVHADSCFQGPHASSLAAFLIGACKYSYYVCSNRFEMTKKNKSLLCWKDDYNKKLGAPLGKAKISYETNDVRFFRQFQSGTKVYVWLQSMKATEINSCICWSDGTSTCKEANCKKMEQQFIKNYHEPLDQWEDDGCA